MKNLFLKSNYLLLCCVWLVICCQYEVNEVSFHNISKPSEPTATIDLPMDKDTIWLAGYPSIQFHFNCPDHKIYSFQFTLGEKQVLNTAGQNQVSGQVDFALDFKQDGIYNLNMTATVNSKSGSMADKLGAEVFSLKKTWIIVYNLKPLKPKLTFVGLSDGTMKIAWTKSRSMNFQQYTVCKAVKNSWSDYWTFQEIETISDSSKNFMTDDTYIGEPVKYFIKLRESYSENYSDTIEYLKMPMPLTFTRDRNLNCIISWPRTLFYKNFGKVVLSYEDKTTLDDFGRSSGNATLLTSTNINDTSVVVKDGLIPDRVYHLYITPKENKYSLSGIGINKEQAYSSISEPSFNATELAFTGIVPYNIYGKYKGTLIQYNSTSGTSRTITLTSRYGLGVSLNERYVICGQYSIDPSTLEATPLYITEFMSLFSDVKKMYVSNNGIFVGENDYAERPVYNLNLSKPLGNIKSIYWINGIKQSPNGEYIVIPGDYRPRIEIWKFDPDSNMYIEKNYFHGDYFGKRVVFCQTTDVSQFYAVNSGNLELWSCELARMLQSTPTEATEVLQIDPVTKNIVAYKPGHLLIYRPSDMALLWDVGIDPLFITDSYFYIWNQFIIVNSVIYTNGRKIDLNKL